MVQDDSLEAGVLARRIVMGRDSAAEALLCHRLFPRIRAYGLRHLRDGAAASDLAQHVLVIVIEALRSDRVSDTNRLASFVMGTCRNTVLEWKKVDRRRGALLERFGPAFASVVQIEPPSLDAAKLAQCVQGLPPRERTILVLTYFGEKEASEIASELAMSLGNIRVARHRALARLHDCLTRGESP
jgi:RNA polymerase sigma-70 factor, ECF subfamily